MNCENAREQFPLLLYGELAFHEEELLEQHLSQCEICRKELEKERGLQALLDEQTLEPPAPLLAECRRGFQARLAPEAELRSSRPRGWLSWLPHIDIHLPQAGYLKPVGALMLVALGFFAARISSVPGSGGFQGASLSEPAASTVRYVETGDAGKVQVVVDETRQRVYTGRLDDHSIRRLLLAAAREPNNPGLRAESVDLLSAETASEEVRRALIHALQHDTNDAVRMKALDALRAYAGEGEVRRALTHALLKDSSPAVRTQAIDLLVAHKREDMVGVLQEVMGREDNSYVRQRCERVLRDFKASAETF